MWIEHFLFHPFTSIPSRHHRLVTLGMLLIVSCGIYYYYECPPHFLGHYQLLPCCIWSFHSFLYLIWSFRSFFHLIFIRFFISLYDPFIRSYLICYDTARVVVVEWEMAWGESSTGGQRMISMPRQGVLRFETCSSLFLMLLVGVWVLCCPEQLSRLKTTKRGEWLC